MDKIEFRLNPQISVAELVSVFRSSGIRRPVDDHERLASMLKNANLTAGAYVAGELVGVARALTDFSYCCYLSDLAVAADYKGHGIGTKLIDCIKEEIGDRCSLILLSAPEAMEFYSKIGFEAAPNAWVEKRRR